MLLIMEKRLNLMDDRIDKQMLDLAIELSSELEEYVNRDFEDNYQDFLVTRNNIGSYIVELMELLKQF